MNAKEAKAIASKKLQEPLSRILTHIEKATKKRKYVGLCI